MLHQCLNDLYAAVEGGMGVGIWHPPKALRRTVDGEIHRPQDAHVALVVFEYVLSPTQLDEVGASRFDVLENGHIPPSSARAFSKRLKISARVVVLASLNAANTPLQSGGM